jgi:integrase
VNGWLKKRDDRKRPDCWSIILDLCPKPAGKVLKQKWITFHGTKQEAKKRLRELLGEADRGEFVEPSKMTVGEWLDEWVEKAVKPRRCERTYKLYKIAIRLHLKPRLGAIPLQQLKPVDVERYHAELGLSSSTSQLHHVVLSSALKLAVRDGLVRRNAAALATSRPAPHPVRESLAWTAEEARSVLKAAKERGEQTAAFIAIALDSGARRSELQGLLWADVDLQTGALRIERQLMKGGLKTPVFGPTKTRKARALDLSSDTIALLREHKRKQSELKLANRPRYQDHGLVFAQAWEHQNSHRAALGAPLNNSALETMLARLVVAAGVRRITLHGLRHTSATLLLAAGVQPHVVQRRLGHSSIATTLDLYAHVLPAQQQDAASRLAELLYGH